MKSKLLISCIATLTIMNFAGCSSKDEVYQPNPIEGECTIQGEKAPVWVCGSYEEANRYVATGSAPFSKLGHNFTRNEALLNARTNLVNQIKIDIKTRAESYMRSTGLQENEMVEKVVSIVSKQTSNMTIANSKQISYWQSSKDNSIFVLVAVNKNSVDSLIDKNLKDAVDNEIQLKNSEDALNRLQ